MRSVLPNDTTLTQGRQQFSGTVEVRHLNVGGADALRVVRIRTDPRRQTEALREFDRRDIVVLVRDLRVEDFDDVQVAGSSELLQHRQAQVGALGIEGMWRVHQSTLGFDAMHHVGHRQNVRNTLGQEQADQLSRRRPDLLANDDANSQVTSERVLRGRDGVVVRDAHHVEADRFHSLGKLIQRGARIARCKCVQMAIKANHSAGSRWWWPNRIQQQEGD